MMRDDTEMLFTKALDMQKRNQIQDAIETYHTLLASNPKHLQALSHLGLAYAQQDDMKNAQDYFLRALILAPNDAQLHNQLANTYKRLSHTKDALHHYQRAIEINPEYAEAHHNLACLYALHNQFYLQSLRHYQKALHIAPDFILAHYNLGLLLLKHHELNAAQTQFNNVINLDPAHADAHFYLGLLALHTNELEKAEQAFQSVLAIDNEHVASLVNLGVIALKREQGRLAIDYFGKALAIDSTHVEARNNIASTFINHDQYQNALTHYQLLLEQDPEKLEYLYNSGVAQMALGHLNEAIELFKSVLKQQPTHFEALINLAAIEMRFNHRKQAITYLQQAHLSKPDDASCQLMLHALTGDVPQPQACNDYVVNLFNNYALYYDAHMQDYLHYALPQQVLSILKSLHINHVSNILDLGCGTGLSGEEFRTISDTLTGVDMATKMLAKARSKGIYDTLIEADIFNYLAHDTNTYALITALDVLPYCGDLAPLFQDIPKRLAKDGLFVFTCEISKDKSWFLQESVRFCHHPDYIHTLCDTSHLSLIHEQEILARRQEEALLPIMLYVVQKSG